MKATCALSLALLIIAAAVLVRQTSDLQQRPMHADEAVHAVRLGTLLEDGRFVYDPTEFHGPSLYYLTLPVVWWQGKHDLASLEAPDLRIVPVVFGVGLILLLPLVADGFGRGGVLWAGLLTAVAPALAYYGRYYIHEILLVFFTFAMIATGWRYWRRPALGWAVGCGAAAGVMHATKETSLIAWAAMAGAIILMKLWSRRAAPAAAERERTSSSRIRPVHLVASLLAGTVVSVVFFSAFFTHARGPLDSILTWGAYFGRGAGVRGDAGLHVHPWYEYLHRLIYWQQDRGPVWSEGAIVMLALVAAIVSVWPRWATRFSVSPLVRFFTFYTLLMLLVYSALPYKTPWLVLGTLHGLILLAGAGATILWQMARGPILKGGLIVLLAVGIWHLHMQVLRTADPRLAADRRNPYVYAHTVRDIHRLTNRVDDLAAVHPQGSDMLIAVVSDNPWPLPWYLRRYTRVGYWINASEVPAAPVTIVAADQAADLERQGEEPAHREHFGLRPGVHLILYTAEDLWEAFIETRR